MNWTNKLVSLNACDEAVTWCRTQPDLETAWAKCDRGDWMLWLSGRLAATDKQRKAVVLAACAVARLALVHVPSGELRPLRAIETTKAWCRGEATIEQVREARRAAFAYADDAYADDAYAATSAAASSAASAAAYAAYAASASAAYAVVAAYAAYAAYVGGAAEAYAYAAAAIARKMLTCPVLK